MTDRRGFLYAAIAFLLLALGVAALFGQTVQLSPGPVKLTSPPSASANSQWAVYLDAQGVGSAPLHGGPTVRLLTLALGRQVFGPVTITPDSQRVVWVADTDTLGKPELYSAPIAGGSSVRISKTMAADRQVRDYVLSPLVSRAYFVADADVNNKLELFRVDAAGGASVKLNKSIGSDWDVFEVAVNSADQVIYRAGRTVQGGHELFSVPGSGTGAQAHRISVSPMVTGGGVSGDFQIAADMVIYRCDALDNGRDDLYSVKLDGTGTTRLDLMDGRSVRKLEVYGSLAYFSYGGSEWYVTSVYGVGAPVPTLEPDPPMMRSPDNRYGVFASGANLVSLDAQTGAMRNVNCAGQVVVPTYLGKPTFSVSSDSKTVLFVANSGLFSGPVSGAVCPLFSDGFENGSASRWG